MYVVPMYIANVSSSLILSYSIRCHRWIEPIYMYTYTDVIHRFIKIVILTMLRCIACVQAEMLSGDGSEELG